MSQATSLLDMWVLYESPDDAPGEWVVRQWFVVPGAPEPVNGVAYRSPSRRRAEAMVPEGRVFLARSPTDEPCIVGTWL
jgi:hypothetical protein